MSAASRGEGASGSPDTNPEPGDWQGYLESLAAFGMRPGLERVSAVLEALGQPQRSFRAIHVVGTNGKSSTTRYAAAILAAHGLRTACYLSPHIHGWAERVQIGGEHISRDAFGAAVLRVREIVAALPAESGETTQFEVLTAAAFVAMAVAGVEAAVIEAGLGGRLDATNVLDAPVVVVTSIGLDHIEVLGTTREAIFAEKAAVIKGGDAVFGPLEGLESAAQEVCARVGARAHFMGPDFSVTGPPSGFCVSTAQAIYPGLSLPTAAAYQTTNAALAVQAAERLLGPLELDRVRVALADVVVPGRLQIVGREPLMIADGAHNHDGMRALLATLRTIDWPRPRVAVIAVMRDKAVAEMVGALAEVVDTIVCTRASQDRSLEPSELASIAKEKAASAAVPPPTILTDLNAHAALRRARVVAGTGGSVVVCGSLYLLEDLADVLSTPSA